MVTTPRKRITAFGLEICEDSLSARRPPPLDDKETKSDAEEHDDEEPDWLDHMYPWSESKRRPPAAEKLRLKRLEQFFDRFTDDEDSADDFDTDVASTPDDKVAPRLRPALSGGRLGSFQQLSTHRFKLYARFLVHLTREILVQLSRDTAPVLSGNLISRILTWVALYM